MTEVVWQFTIRPNTPLDQDTIRRIMDDLGRQLLIWTGMEREGVTWRVKLEKTTEG